MDAGRVQRARAIGCLRAVVGLGLIIAPRAVARAQLGTSSAGPLILLLRTVGIRDLVLGAGTVAASYGAHDAEVRRWIGAGLVSDALDVVAGAASVSAVGTAGGLTAAALPLPFILCDLWALGYMRAPGPPASTPGSTAARRR